MSSKQASDNGSGAAWYWRARWTANEYTMTAGPYPSEHAARDAAQVAALDDADLHGFDFEWRPREG